jgi:hypothetical protein
MNKLLLTFCLIAFFGHQSASAQISQQQAAKATYIPDIKIASDTDDDTTPVITYVDKDTKPGGGRYFCGALDRASVDKAAMHIKTALKKLPDSAWSKINLKYLLLCSSAKANGTEIGGIPVPPIKLLMLSTGRNASNGKYLSSIALHELYHLIEFQDNSHDDSSWNAQFSGYRNSYGSNATKFGSGGKGFINSYGKNFPYEERAEIFSILKNNPRELSDYIESSGDSVLLDKVKFMRDKCLKMLGDSAC